MFSTNSFRRCQRRIHSLLSWNSICIRHYHQNKNAFNRINYGNYQEYLNSFQWDIPSHFNIGYACCDHHVDIGNGDNTALYDYSNQTTHSFRDIYKHSNQLCNAFQFLNIQKQDRIGVLLPQSFECVISHLSAFKSNCISLPLFSLFGSDSLIYRLNDSGCKLIITNQDCLPNILSIRHELTSLEHIIITGHNSDCYEQTKDIQDIHIHSFDSLIDKASTSFECINTSSNDPAIIIYTSGTTGNAKGCLHAHRVMLGRLPGFEVAQHFSSPNNKAFWTPADFAWIGGLMTALKAWYYGVPMVIHQRAKFDPQEAFHIMNKYDVSTTFLPPTALKLMKQYIPENDDKYYHKLLNLSSGGEYLGKHLHDWGHTHFGVTINEFYSQTECSVIISNAPHIFDFKLGSMGKAVPGHTIELIDDNGNIINEEDVIGNICVEYPNPVMFLNYWNDEQRTNDKFIEIDDKKWLVTGDLAKKDKDGYFYYYSRSDDVIISAGYRIGPAEIESVVMKHPVVADCAVIGVPDEIKNEVVKLFVVLKHYVPNNEHKSLKVNIQTFVKDHVGKHEYPKYIEFVESLPRTVTKKIQRHKLREYLNTIQTRPKPWFELGLNQFF